VADRRVDHLLVGGGIASAYCAAELRKRGAEGSILLAGREPEPPYDRPPLSKEYLRGDASREDGYVHPLSWYEDNDVELLTGRSVISLDAGARTAKIQGGEEVEFGTALLATGAMVNILRVDGAQLEGIHYLRAYGNSDSIREDVAAAEHVVCVGGSYIGAEVAASLTEMGKRCTIVEIEPVILSRAFGTEVGRRFQSLLADRGIEFAVGETVAAFEGDERVSTVLTESGLAIDCDAVVVGAGVRPDTMLAGRAGLEVENGIVCDSGLEASAEGIFAAGDCCNYDSELHGGRARFEHWDVALHQGRHAARGMLGEKSPYRVVPYFFSDLSDWASLEYVGGAADWDEVLWRGDLDAGEYSAWYLRSDRVVAALSVGRSEDLLPARRLIESGEPVGESRDSIADPDADLADLG
jgi:3-phenylpropionate/trans-cinnamate dioxygenase ferredoxin reductase subunit